MKSKRKIFIDINSRIDHAGNLFEEVISIIAAVFFSFPGVE